MDIINNQKYVLGKDWFEKYQEILLFFVNSWIGRRFFGIEKRENEYIKITPNSLTWETEKKGIFQTEFLTYNRYSIYLFEKLNFIWQLFHLWDMTIANPIFPNLNLGFDTLTVYPNPVSLVVHNDSPPGGTATNDTSIGAIAWSNPDNAKVNDSNFATLQTADTAVSNYLKITNFGLSITDYVIGIQAKISSKRSGGTNGNISANIKLVKSDGTFSSGTRTSIFGWNTTELEVGYGDGLTDLWGETWGASDVSNSNFGVALSVYGDSACDRIANVNYVTVTIYTVVSSEILGSMAHMRLPETNENISDIATGNGTNVSFSATGVQINSGSIIDTYRQLNRAAFQFDTSSLTAKARISGAQFSLYSQYVSIIGSSKLTDLGFPDLDIVAYTGDTNFLPDIIDYQSYDSDVFATITNASWIDETRISVNLTLNGQANINKLGFTGIGARLNWDVDNNFTGSWVSNSMSGFSWHPANSAPTTDPKLIVSYTLDDLTEIKFENNLIVDANRQSYIVPIATELLGLEFYPTDSKTVGLYYYEIGDRITLIDANGNSFDTTILGIDIGIGTGDGERIYTAIPTLGKTNYSFTGIVGRKITDTSIKVDKQNALIELTSTNLTKAISDITLTTNSITSSVQAVTNNLNDAKDNIKNNSDLITSVQTDLTTLQQTADSLSLKITQTGGVNLLKNSVGLKGTITEWQIFQSDGVTLVDSTNNGIIDQSTDTVSNTTSGSAIIIANQNILQTFSTIKGQIYTFFMRYKSTLSTTLSITGSADITIPASASWITYKVQFTAGSSSTTLKLANGSSASATLSDMIVILGDINAWQQAPNEVYGKNFIFDKNGFAITSLTDPFQSILNNKQLAVYDTSSGSQKTMMLVSKDSGQITQLIVADQLTVERYGNSAAAMRTIPQSDGVFIVIND